ncbi:MAG: hypothetical protein QGI73_00440 [Candidatus Thalassarchaeaceae archaeon]|jgi:hypothetical protein|nr:hypothetical protein [Candidatus Thalassarchaeaceae archaeon]|tara:strand:+ start:4129 stop:4311 length:183 start_codon:yes stop_codon:yes gene_type:complete
MGELQDEGEGNRKANREIDSLRRERDSVQRLINQVKLGEVRESLELLRSRMDAIERILEN